jgi:gamma-glutamyl:cysteine ligase YbdK (ATP-grasp superfamily)
METLGPEHEFSLVDNQIKPLPISDRIIKHLCGRIVNNISRSGFIFGKELQKHVVEFKAATPFRSPICFEETMQKAVDEITNVLDRFGAQLLGTGMHPTLGLNETRVWDHRDKHIYEALDHIFNLKQHGWLNIQSFQLNLPYLNEEEGVKLYNILVNILPYIVAISASSPIYESKFGEFLDNRLHFYWINQTKIPSITGSIIPKPIDSFETYRNLTIQRYSADLMKINAPISLINKDWINSRGAIFRFDRRTIEIRIMDEQECIKADVALSCFIRALIRGLMQNIDLEISHPTLIKDLRLMMKDGLNAKVNHFESTTARDMCRYLLSIAYENASKEERSYLKIIKKKIEDGSLAENIVRHIRRRAQKTDLSEAILSVYSTLALKLRTNEIYS